MNLRRRLPILAAVLMLVLAVGCSNNNAEVERLRKEVEMLKAATPTAVISPTAAPIPTAAPSVAAAPPVRAAESRAIVVKKGTGGDSARHCLRPDQPWNLQWIIPGAAETGACFNSPLNPCYADARVGYPLPPACENLN